MAYIGLKQLDPILTGSLQVSGSAGFTGSLSLRAGDKLFTEADEGTYLQSDSADRLRAVVGGSQMLLMDQDEGRVNVGYGQKVGIALGNHTTPGVELEIDGDVSGSGLGSFGNVYAGTHITASGNISASGAVYGSTFYDLGVEFGADYVFEPEYILRTLPEVEEHIEEHQHLPGLPPADDINGWKQLSIGDRDMKLLEKVEELTLYVIDLQKQIDELKNK